MPNSSDEENNNLDEGLDDNESSISKTIELLRAKLDTNPGLGPVIEKLEYTQKLHENIMAGGDSFPLEKKTLSFRELSKKADDDFKTHDLFRLDGTFDTVQLNIIGFIVKKHREIMDIFDAKEEGYSKDATRKNPTKTAEAWEKELYTTRMIALQFIFLKNGCMLGMTNKGNFLSRMQDIANMPKDKPHFTLEKNNTHWFHKKESKLSKFITNLEKEALKLAATYEAPTLNNNNNCK